MGAAARAAKVSKARCHHAKSKRPAFFSASAAQLGQIQNSRQK